MCTGSPDVCPGVWGHVAPWSLAALAYRKCVSFIKDVGEKERLPLVLSFVRSISLFDGRKEITCDS